MVQSHDLKYLSENLSSIAFLSKNDFKLKKEIQESFKFLKYIDSLGSSLIAFSDLSEENFSFTLISENQPGLKLDSVKNKSVERLKFDNFEIEKVVLEENIFFISRTGGVFLAGNSLEKLKTLLEGESFLNDTEFQKVLKATDPKETSIFFQHEQIGEKFKEWFPATDSTLTKFANWSAVDLNHTNASLNFNGLSLWPEKPGFQHIFKDVDSSPNQIAAVVPATAPGFSSFGYKNFRQFQQNFKTYFQKEFSEVEKEILKNVSEIGLINYPSDKLLVLNNIDVILTEQNLARFSGESKEFRGTKIFQFENPQLFADHLEPLINPVDLNFYTVLKNFVIFGKTEEHLQKVISAFMNKNTLLLQEHFQDASHYLAETSNVLIVTNNEEFKKLIKEVSSAEFGNEISKLDFDNYKVSAIQLVADKNFSHIHGIFHKSRGKSPIRNTEEILSVKLDEEILGKPVFFSNHNNNQKDIAVQDINNVLYLISNKGDIYWKKQLNGPILGEIQEVDILKNGKFQLAFATPDRLEVIARNGKPVKPFPLKFKDEITQPLSLFDYDNNRNYRFLITQNKEQYMYDSKGRSVKGFGFNSTDSKVLFPPRHIRMGNKDYIVIAEESGKLNILSRQGRHRVRVNERFDFSDNEWFQYEGHFISSNNLGELILINKNGKVSNQNLNLAQNHKIDATSNLLVSFSENILRIRDKEVVLDFGLYTEPQIFLENNKYYISITDLQTQKVYVFDSNAELLSGFPVYGTSTIDLSNINNDNAPEFVVKGDKGEILIYRF